MRFCVKCSVCQSQGREYLISFVVCTRIELQRSAKNAARSFVAPEVGKVHPLTRRIAENRRKTFVFTRRKQAHPPKTSRRKQAIHVFPPLKQLVHPPTFELRDYTSNIRMTKISVSSGKQSVVKDSYHQRNSQICLWAEQTL